MGDPRSGLSSEWESACKVGPIPVPVLLSVEPGMEEWVSVPSSALCCVLPASNVTRFGGLKSLFLFPNKCGGMESADWLLLGTVGVATVCFTVGDGGGEECVCVTV